MGETTKKKKLQQLQQSQTQIFVPHSIEPNQTKAISQSREKSSLCSRVGTKTDKMQKGGSPVHHWNLQHIIYDGSNQLFQHQLCDIQ